MELRPRFTVCNPSWDISLVLLPSAWPYATLFSSNPASPCVLSLMYIACSDMPDAFSLTPTVWESAAPPYMSSAVLYAVRSRHLSRLPEDATMRLFVSLVSPSFFGDAAFLLVDCFLPPETTLLLRIDSALAV